MNSLIFFIFTKRLSNLDFLSAPAQASPTGDPDPSLQLGYSLYQVIGSGLAGAAVAGVIAGLVMTRTVQRCIHWLTGYFRGYRTMDNQDTNTNTNSSDYETFHSTQDPTSTSFPPDGRGTTPTWVHRPLSRYSQLRFSKATFMLSNPTRFWRNVSFMGPASSSSEASTTLTDVPDASPDDTPSFRPHPTYNNSFTINGREVVAGATYNNTYTISSQDGAGAAGGHGQRGTREGPHGNVTIEIHRDDGQGVQRNTGAPQNTPDSHDGSSQTESPPSTFFSEQEQENPSVSILRVPSDDSLASIVFHDLRPPTDSDVEVTTYVSDTDMSLTDAEDGQVLAPEGQDEGTESNPSVTRAGTRYSGGAQATQEEDKEDYQADEG